ncbi:hypothetical protein [Burkholderia ubonensis]|uniref:hypothetical protein n=1 Tax=Burkholderia ubonensis TaxID=101571 RepID=UPI001178653B|nr:hypothetical protein [Burkholderia ubonensis]
MKETSGTAGSPVRSSGVRVDFGAMIRAKRRAQDLREAFERLSPVERLLAKVYIDQVRELVEAVEAL